MVIRWNASITHPAGPVRDYLVQVKEEDDDPLRLKNCLRIEEIASSFTCVLDNLKSGTVYFVRVAARNIVGYSDFTEEEIRTKDVDEGTRTSHINTLFKLYNSPSHGEILFVEAAFCCIAVITKSGP